MGGALRGPRIFGTTQNPLGRSHSQTVMPTMRGVQIFCLNSRGIKSNHREKSKTGNSPEQREETSEGLGPQDPPAPLPDTLEPPPIKPGKAQGAESVDNQTW